MNQIVFQSSPILLRVAGIPALQRMPQRCTPVCLSGRTGPFGSTLGRGCVSDKSPLNARRLFARRGIDSDEHRHKRGENFAEEFGYEVKKQMEYFNSVGKMMDDADEVREMMKSRSHLPEGEKILPEEKDFIDKIVGTDEFEALVNQMAQKARHGVNGAEEAQFSLLIILKRVQDMCAKAGIDRSVSKRFPMDMFVKETMKMPPVNAADGFSPNEAVLKRFEEDKAEIAKYMSIRSGHPVTLELPNVLKSPFGPVSSAVCYEELSNLNSLHLEDLFQLNCGRGGTLPRTKIYLTVVAEAFETTSSIHTVVQDDSGQYIRLQIYNGKLNGVKKGTIGIDSLPVGGRFYLKNPFLKVAADNWWLLRVDQPLDLQRIDLPPLHGSILIVGDGDFSYSLALAQENTNRGNASIVATSLDPRDKVIETYEQGRHNLDELNAHPNITVFHEADATEIAEDVRLDTMYDSIVWNFPYPSRVQRAAPKEGGNLVRAFLQSAKHRLAPSGMIYLTLAKRQGGTTREAAAPTLAWDIEEQAYQSGLDLIEVVPFPLVDFTKYTPKRAYADSSFPSDNARTHIFRAKDAERPLGGDRMTERSLISRMGAFTLEKMFGWSERSHRHVNIERSIELLKLDAKHSPVANDLYQSALILQDLWKKFPSKDEFDNMATPEKIEANRAITSLIAEVYATRDGELLVLIDSREVMSILHESCCIALVSYLCNDTKRTEAALDQTGLNLKSLYQKNTGIMNPSDDNDFRHALFANTYLMYYLAINNKIPIERVLSQADDNCEMFPNDPHFFDQRATINVNRLADVVFWKSKSVQRSIIDDCTMVMDLIGDDNTDSLFQSALYKLAFAHRSSIFGWKYALPLYEKYVQIVDPTDRSLPAAYYNVAFHSIICDISVKGMTAESLARARKYYELGLQAEKKRIKFFGPCNNDAKNLLSMMLMVKNDQLREITPDEGKAMPNDLGIGSSPKKAEESFFRQFMGDVMYKKPTSRKADTSTSSDKNVEQRKMRTCTAEETKALSEDNTGPLYIGAVPEVYRAKYGKNPIQGSGGLKKALQMLKKLGLFSLKLLPGKKDLRLHLDPKEENSDLLKDDGRIVCTPAEVRDILMQQRSRSMSISSFAAEYRRKYGKCANNGIKLKKALENLGRQSGTFDLEQRVLGSKRTLALVLSKTEEDETLMLSENIEALLLKYGDVNLGELPALWKKEFGQAIPLRGRKVSQLVREQTMGSDRIEISHRGKRSSIWITLKK